MKRIFLSSLIVLAGLQLPAQIRLGVKAGLATTEINVNDLDILDDGGADRLQVALNDAKYGIHLGGFLRLPLGESFLLQPELVFNSNTVEFGVEDLDQPNPEERIFKEKYQYLDIPVLLTMRIGPFRALAGPQGHIFLNSTSDLFEFSNYEQTFENMTVNWQAGVGLDLWNVTLDLRYEGNFNKFGDHIVFWGQEYAFNRSASRWLFSLGLMLGSN